MLVWKITYIDSYTIASPDELALKNKIKYVKRLDFWDLCQSLPLPTSHVWDFWINMMTNLLLMALCLFPWQVISVNGGLK